jgi:hypothetical protein
MTKSHIPTTEEESLLRKSLFDYFSSRSLPGFASMVEMIEIECRSGRDIQQIGSASIVDPDNMCRKFKVALGIAPKEILNATSPIDLLFAQLDKKASMANGTLHFGGNLEYVRVNVSPTTFLDLIRDRIHNIPPDVLAFVDKIAESLSGVRGGAVPIVHFEDGPPHSYLSTDKEGKSVFIEYTSEERRVFELKNMREYLDSYPHQCRVIDESEERELKKLRLRTELGWKAPDITLEKVRATFNDARAEHRTKKETYERELALAS